MRIYITTIISLFLSLSCYAVSLLDSINAIIQDKKLTLGLSIYDVDSDQVLLTINGDRRFPMQSVYKFPIALALLDRVDRGLLSIDDSIVVKKSDLLPNTWSPMRDRYPNGAVLSIEDLISYTVAMSDNNVSDLVMRMAGGASGVDLFVRQLGVDDISIRNYECELKADSSLQYENYSTPDAMVKLIELFNQGVVLSSLSQSLLWRVMCDTKTSSIRDLLPGDLVVAYKSGYSGVDESGVIAANNVVGVMVLPSGRRLIFSIFISDARESAEVCYRVIAEIAATIYREGVTCRCF